MKIVAYTLLAAAFYSTIALAVDEKVEKLLISSGGYSHRLSIHRKKSERHRDLSSQNAYPMPNEDTNPEMIATHEVGFDDGPTARRHLGNIYEENRKDDKKTNAKDMQSSEKRQVANKESDHIKKRQDRMKVETKDKESSEKKQDDMKADKERVPGHIVKEKKKNDVAEKVERKKEHTQATEKDATKLTNKKQAVVLINNSGGNDWDIAADDDDDDNWKDDDWSGDDWGNLGCICDDWKSTEHWTSHGSRSLERMSSTNMLKKRMQKMKNKRIQVSKEEMPTIVRLHDGVRSTTLELLRRNLTSLAKKFAVAEPEETNKEDKMMKKKTNGDKKQTKLDTTSDGWNWRSKESSESWDWWSAEDSWSSRKSSKSKSSKSKSLKSSKSQYHPIKWCSCNPTYYPTTKRPTRRPVINPPTSRPSKPPTTLVSTYEIVHCLVWLAIFFLINLTLSV
jgi:hypothetical protein